MKFKLTSATKELAAISAGRLGVSPAIHPEDFIFRFVYEHPGFESKAGAVDYYFNDGHKSAEKVKVAFDKWVSAPAGHDCQILEFASGYGAVSRHLGLLKPNGDIQSCDIHPDAMAFIEENFGLDTVTSCEVPEELVLPHQYDFIFVLSFFSHMPHRTWARWLRKLYGSLSKGGILLFTTHGRVSMQHFPQAELDSSGYWFEQSSEQKDLDVETYGQAITAKHYVDAQIDTLDDVIVRDYQEAAWWDHQDLYVIERSR